MAKYVYETRVRYNEVDSMGIVHNSIYYIYMELARTDLVRHEGITYKEMEAAGVLIPVVESGCRFFTPARYDDLIRVETTVAYVKNASIRFEYTLKQADGKRIAKGYTVHAAVSSEFEVVTIPDEWRSIFDKYLESDTKR